MTFEAKETEHEENNEDDNWMNNKEKKMINFVLVYFGTNL